MEYNTVIAPNLNGIVYRNHIPERNKINTFLDIVDIDKDGHMFLCSTNLNGRYWDGSVCYFKNYSVKELSNEIDSSINLDTGISDGKFFNDKIIISHDSGDLNILENSDGELKCIEKYHNNKHEDRITEISVWPNSNFFVTSCADASINTWEITESKISSVHEFEDAHYNLVSSVNANPSDFNLFASCSYDHSAIMWDKRAENVGKVIYENEFCALTKIEWHPSKSNILVVTTSSGDIFLIDTREPNKFISKNSCFMRSIHNTCFAPNGLLAVCADDTQVKVLDTTNDDLKLLLIDERHNDFVRGLAWYDTTLISCGWDKQVLLHYP